MPSYIFTGPYPTTYPESRDVNGVPLQTVEPGDIRMFDDPPGDGMWAPEIPPRDDSGEGAADEAGTAEGDAPAADEPQPVPEPAPPGPAPAPPAVIPGT